MIVNLKRCLSILLAVMLLIGIIPAAYAVESGADSTQPEKTVSEGTESTDSIDPTEPTEPTEPPDIANPQDDYAVMSVGSTQKSIMLFDYADNGNYTTVLKSQVSCEYKPNGTGAARTAYIKNLGWHFARYGGVAYPDEPLYCIEPWRNYGASTSGNSVDRGVTLDGSGSTTGSNVWYAMPEDYREAIGLILLYSDRMWDHSVSVTTTKKDSNPNVPLRIATQFLIYEIPPAMTASPTPSASTPKRASSTASASVRVLTSRPCSTASSQLLTRMARCSSAPRPTASRPRSSRSNREQNISSIR